MISLLLEVLNLKIYIQGYFVHIHVKSKILCLQVAEEAAQHIVEEALLLVGVDLHPLQNKKAVKMMMTLLEGKDENPAVVKTQVIEICDFFELLIIVK